MVKKILICGLGSIGRKYVRLIRSRFPQISLAALRSGFGPSSQEEKLLDYQFYCEQEALTWKPDGVVIATPATYHLQQALFFASKNIPLLIEKPLGTGLEQEEDWDQLQIFALQVPILVGYVLRYDSCLNWLKDQLTSKSIGRLLEADFYCGSWLPSWREDTNYTQNVSARSELGGGVLLELSHEIDLAFWLLSDTIEINSAISSRSELLDIDVEDQVVIAAKTTDSVLLTIRLNFCTQPSRRIVCLRGQNGELSCDLISNRASMSLIDKAPQGFSSEADASERYLHQLDHFMSCIQGLELPICTVNDGLNVLKVIQQTRELIADRCQ